MGTHKVQLTPGEAELVRRPLRGQGGFQSFLEDLQRRLGTDNKVTLTAAMIKKIRRYAEDYGGGGLRQRLLEGLIAAIKRSGIDPANPGDP